MVKEKLTKADKVKIETRKDFLKFATKRISDVEVGDYDQEEFEIFRQEITEITDFLKNKDKYMELMHRNKQGRNRNISKYFNLDK